LADASAAIFASGLVLSPNPKLKLYGCQVGRGGAHLMDGGPDADLRHDITGRLRDTTNPSIGAWEIERNDAGTGCP
jgi:hypothetical protein